MRNPIFSPALLLILLLSCIDPVPLPINNRPPGLVVDGTITQEAGPHSVQLYYSASYPTDPTPPVSGAQVKVVEEGGAIEDFTETKEGVYESSALWQPIIGKSYHLEIILIDGRVYASEVQTLNPGGILEELETTFVPNSINADNPTAPQHAVFVAISGAGDQGKPNLYRWRWREVFEIFTYPELKPRSPGTPPPVCSGIETSAACSCCRCWATNKNKVSLVSDPLRGLEYHQKLLFKIPADGFRFGYKYYLEVEQLSLSSGAYTFWKRLQTQQGGFQNIFQPNAIRIPSNITCITNPDERVFGVFAVSGVARKSKFLTIQDLDGYYPKVDSVRDECFFFSKSIPPGNVTNEKPPFW